MCVSFLYLLQEAAENLDNPENKRRSWYSNPGASSFGGDEGAGGGGVGKYLELPGKKVGSSLAGEKEAGSVKRPAAGAGAVAAAASKKPKADLAGFDAW
jgi:hypothetical protein